MDSATNIRSWGELVTRGIASPNEARAEFQLGPVQGGESPYLQQQNYSLAALDKRDTLADPFGVAPKPTPIVKSRHSTAAAAEIIAFAEAERR